MSLLGTCTGGQVDSGNASISSTVTFTTVVLCSSSNACIVRQKPHFRALKFLCKVCSVHAAPNSCWVCTHCTLQLESSVRAAARSCWCQPEHSALQACAHLHVVRFETSSRAALTCCVCRPDSVIIWTRFTPGNSSAVPVTWHMSTSPPEAGGGNSSAEGSVALHSIKGFVEASRAHVSLKCTLRSACIQGNVVHLSFTGSKSTDSGLPRRLGSAYASNSQLSCSSLCMALCQSQQLTNGTTCAGRPHAVLLGQ
jgi:hypothetical protein